MIFWILCSADFAAGFDLDGGLTPASRRDQVTSHCGDQSILHCEINLTSAPGGERGDLRRRRKTPRGEEPHPLKKQTCDMML